MKSLHHPTSVLLLFLVSTAGSVAAFVPCVPFRTNTVSNVRTTVWHRLSSMVPPQMSEVSIASIPGGSKKKKNKKKKNKKQSQQQLQQQQQPVNLLEPLQVSPPPPAAVVDMQEQQKVEKAPIVVVDVGPKAPPKTRGILPPRDPVREERIARSLLKARLELEALMLSRKRNVVIADVGPKAPPKVRAPLPPTDPVRAEHVIRSLLKQRLELEVNARAKRVALQNKRLLESKQRGLLVNRLKRQEKIRTALREKRAKLQARQEAIKMARQQPKSPQEEATLAAKYASISDLGERSFQILLDLGMVEETPNPNSPDYDNSDDDEYVPGMIYLE